MSGGECGCQDTLCRSQSITTCVVCFGRCPVARPALCLAPIYPQIVAQYLQSPDAGWDVNMGKIVNPDDPDQDNGTKLLNYCIVIGPGQVCKISN
ncbi:hypothetical protein TNCV_2415881 [Trichonephila clavipes]|nr:hypothetical protein TNCV_2415881 [Trichonephila clavipes]